MRSMKTPQKKLDAQRRYRARHQFAIRERRKSRHALDLAQSRARYAANPGRYREQFLIRKYGLTLAAFDAMFAAQGGRCASCQTDEFVGPGKKPHVDHDHYTGEVRGLVCVRCNVILGMAQDDCARLEACIRYLGLT